MHSAVDVRLAPSFFAQHHVIARGQALAAGCTPRMIDHRLATGAWVGVARGVYRLAGAPPSWRSDVMAACLQLGPGAVASHEAAAALHGLHAAPLPLAAVTVERLAPNHPVTARVHVTRVLPPAHRTVIDGIPATTIGRTLVDLAGTVRRRRLERLVDDALVARRVAFEELDEAFGALARRGRPGIAAMRAVLAERGPGIAVPESELEARVLRLLRRHGVTPPVLQVDLPWARGTGRVDLAWPADRLVVEADGRRWHARYEHFGRDRARDRAALLGGWRVLRFTWEDVDRTPEVVVADIRRALASPAPPTARS